MDNHDFLQLVTANSSLPISGQQQGNLFLSDLLQPFDTNLNQPGSFSNQIEAVIADIEIKSVEYDHYFKENILGNSTSELGLSITTSEFTISSDYSDPLTGDVTSVSGEALLDLATVTAKEQLESFASDEEFIGKMNLAFGDDWQPQEANTLIENLVSGEAIPKIEILPAANLKANGAFGEDTIYLSEEFLTKNVANREAVAGVLLEEIGHYVDRELNSVDSPGDEGDIFARLVQGETIDGAELAALKTENDSATITLNEQETTVELADPLLFQDEVVRIANEEWEFFDRGAIEETEEGAWQQIVEYFQAANRPDVDTPEEVENTAWSAAFISWVMQEAGAGDEFIYSALHADYINQAIEDRESEAAFIAHPINEYSLQPGDLIGANRPDNDGSDGSDVIVSYDDAVDTGGYSSHVDIVVAIRPGEIDVIGGNVSDSVTLNTYKVDPEGKLTNPDDGDPSDDFFVVIENRLGDVDPPPPPPSEPTSTPPYKDYIVHEGTPIGVNPRATQFLTGDYDGDGKSDLFSIVTQGTGTNSTEVHVLSGASNYQDWIVHEGTPIGVNPAATQFLTGDYDGDGRSDLFQIITEGTGTNSTEVHVLSAASNYQDYIVHEGTPIGVNPAATQFLTGDYDGDGKSDLFSIVTQETGTNSTEVHVLSGASNYQDWIVHEGTPIGVNPAATQFLTGDYDGDGRSDLFQIITEGTGTNSTEVHVLSAASNYQDYIVHEGTPIGVNPAATQLLTGDYDGDGRSDLFQIITEGTGTNSTEVHVLSDGIDDASTAPLPTDPPPPVGTPPVEPTDINQAGLLLVEEFEGYAEQLGDGTDRVRAYRDPGGVLTIGFGHTGSDVTEGLIITRAEAEQLLRGDLDEAEATVSDLVTVPLNENQFSALASLVFNIGEPQFEDSTLLELLNQSMYQEAADQFLVWNKDNGAELAGLTRRREEERELFLTPPVA